MKMRRQLLLSCAVLLGFSAVAMAQQTIVAGSRSINWTGAGVPGGIPARNAICTTLGTAGQASTYVQSVTAAQINSAIASCFANQVVLLNTGTYNLSSGIIFNNKSNVTLRGSGAQNTLLKFSGGLSCNGLGAAVCVVPSDPGWFQDAPGNTASWIAGYSQGATVVTLSSVTNLSAGRLLMLDQLDDTSDDGTIYNCQTVGTCTSQGTDVGRANRGQHQLVRVVSITGNDVTITPGLYMPNWRSNRTPGAWWSSAQPVTGVGIEDASFDFTGVGTSRTYGFQLQMSFGSWIKGVRSIKANNAHVNEYLSSHTTIRDSYFYNSQNACSQSYGFEPWMGGDSLWENNIFVHVSSPLVMSGGQGIVAAYNYAIDDYFNCGDSAWFQSASYLHESSSNYNLWEGNIQPGLTADNIHGPSFFNTAFRNRYDGKDPLNTNAKSEQTVAVNLYSFNRHFNLVGNVLGTIGYHTNYETYATTTGAQSGSNCDTVIYRLGWGGHCDNSQNVGDPTLRTTIMRWGNYDTVNAAVRWQASEVPTAITYANPLPSQTLPASFYLPAQPTWWVTPWGTPKWPAIGPDVSGGNISGVGGHADKIPAQLCYEHLTNDPAFAANTVRVFGASGCYASGSATLPAAPTNVRIIKTP